MSDSIEKLINELPDDLLDLSTDNGRSLSSEVISDGFNKLLNTMQAAHAVDRDYFEKRRRVQQIRKMLSDLLPGAYLYELYDDFIIVAHEGAHGFIRLTYTYDGQWVSILASEQEVVEQRLIMKKDGRMLRRWAKPDEEEPSDTLWFQVL